MQAEGVSAAGVSLYSAPQKQAQPHKKACEKDGDRPVVRFQLIGKINARSEPVEDLVCRDKSDESHSKRDQDRDQVIGKIHSSSRCTTTDNTARCVEKFILSSPGRNFRASARRWGWT